MMSSIFSPFDAAFEESFGLWRPIRPKKLVGRNSTSACTAQDDVVATGNGTCTGTGTAVNQSQSSMMMIKTATATSLPPQQQQQREAGEIVRKPESCWAPTSRTGPRFAVELDGVHCFETVVPF